MTTLLKFTGAALYGSFIAYMLWMLFGFLTPPVAGFRLVGRHHLSDRRSIYHRAILRIGNLAFISPVLIGDFQALQTPPFHRLVYFMHRLIPASLAAGISRQLPANIERTHCGFVHSGNIWQPIFAPPESSCQPSTHSLRENKKVIP